MKTELQTIFCHYVAAGLGDYLPDLHNRDKEFLISASPTQDKEQLVDLFWDSAIYCDHIPTEISDSEIKEAIRQMVDSLSEIDLEIWSEALEIEEDFQVWAYLSW